MTKAQVLGKARFKTNLPPSEVKEFEDLVCRFRQLATLFGKGKDEKIEEKDVKEIFAKVYHKDVVYVRKTGEEDGYDVLYKRFMERASSSYRVRMVNIKFDRHRDDLSFRYVVRGDGDADEFVIRARAFTKNGMVVRVEEETFAARNKIPGQMTATDTKHVLNDLFPTEESLSDSIRRLPNEVKGKFLCEGTDIEPVRELYEVIRVNFSCQGSRVMSMHDMEENAFAGGAAVETHKKCFSRQKDFLLRVDDAPIALCIREPCSSIHRKYTVYGREAIREDKRGSKVCRESVEFFPWFRIRDKGSIPYMPIYVWDGREFAPFLRAETAEQLRNHQNQQVDDGGPGPLQRPMISSFAKTKTAGVVIREIENHVAYGFVVPKSSSTSSSLDGYSLTVAPGVDPGMMVCIAIALGDMVEFRS